MLTCCSPAAPSTPPIPRVRGRRLSRSRDGRILAVGRASQLADLRGPATEVVNLAGKLLLPGFTESHIHFIELALRAAQVDATQARSAGEVVELVRGKLTGPSGLHRPDRPDAWIRGGGWNANIWTDGVKPHRALLDAVAAGTPVALDSKDLHAVWVNSAALRRAGIAAATADVPGGVIERDADGEPTGILRENAVGLVRTRLSQAGPGGNDGRGTGGHTGHVGHGDCGVAQRQRHL